MARTAAERKETETAAETTTASAPAADTTANTTTTAQAQPELTAAQRKLDLRTRTLRGDVRDAILREFKGLDKPWQKMTEDEQSRLIQRAGDIAGTIIRGAVDVVAENGQPAMVITVGKATLDGSAIKGTYECSVDDDQLLAVRHLMGRRAMFVLADPLDYAGQRAPAKPDNVGELAMPNGRTADGADDDAGDIIDPTTGEVSATDERRVPRYDDEATDAMR